MIFKKTPLKGAWLIRPEPSVDKRGLFCRTFCEKEFAAKGLRTRYPQCNTSFNGKKGTLRGLHFQKPPHQEAKIVRCTAGKVFDVIVDLRKKSSTYLKWHGVILSAENRLSLYVPGGFAHGFLTLQDKSEVFYMMGREYHPESARGARWDDPAFGIKWPAPVRMVSRRDGAYPDYKSR